MWVWLIATTIFVCGIVGTVIAGIYEDAGIEIDRTTTDGGVIHTEQHIYKPITGILGIITGIWGIVIVVLSIAVLIIGVDEGLWE